MKKALSLLLAICLMTGLSACGAKDTPTDSNTQTTTTTTQNQTETTTITTATTTTETNDTSASNITTTANTTQPTTTATTAVTKNKTTITKKPLTSTSLSTTTTTTKPSPKIPTWTGISVDKNTIKITSDTNITKTITINTDHMEPEYDDGNEWAAIEDLTRLIYGYGDWIVCCEWYMHVSGSGYNASAREHRDAFIIRTDGTAQQVVRHEKDNGGGYKNQYVCDIAGVQDGWMYYFTFEGDRAIVGYEKCNLYKLKIDGGINDLITQGTFVKEMNTINMWCYLVGSAYMKDGWVYYQQNFEDFTDDPVTHLYKIKCDGTGEQQIF